MLNINIRKSELPLLNETNFVSSKKIAVDVWLEWIIQISFSDRNLTDIIEKLLVDLLITKLDKFWDVYDSFSLILEKLNKELKTLRNDYNLDALNIFVWIVQWDVLHFSILWWHSIYLIKNWKISDIAEWMQWKNLEFSYISSWNVTANDIIFVANLNLLDYVTKDDVFEIMRTESIDKLEIIEKILTQEATSEQYSLISITNSESTEAESRNTAINVIKNKFLSIKDRLIENEKVEGIIEKFKQKVNLKNKYVYLSFLSIGALIAIGLLYAIINSILTNEMAKSVPLEYKNKLIEAKLLLERTNKDLWNKDVFLSNIKKAEDIIFEVRGKWIFMNDVNKLLDYISVLKKQLNWIETFSVSKDKAEIEFSDKDFSLIGIFELNKKFYYVWNNSIIGPYIKWEQIKTYRYPDWEEVVSADVSPEWNIYLLTKTYRILQFYKQEFKYVSVEWQQTWEESSRIKTFNWNLYLLSSKWNQLFRHKPGVSWFASRFWVLNEEDSKKLNLIDFAIDWWFYLLKSDLSIDKIFTTPSYTKRSIIINNLPKNYSNTSWNAPKLFVWQNLNYTYMLLDNKVWIFETDSKNYKDVKSIKYIWQIELSEWNINDFYVQKDWTVYIWTSTWVYLVHFEVSDWKVMLR